MISGVFPASSAHVSLIVRRFIVHYGQRHPRELDTSRRG
jgi:hypothetical protein